MSRMKAQIKIYGERNCGTNYLYNLLTTNIDCNILGGTVPRYIASYPEWVKDTYFSLFSRKTLGWKHGCPVNSRHLKRFCDEGGVLLTISKSPYAFLSSSFKRPYGMVQVGKDASLIDFLKTECSLKGRDRINTNSAITPVTLWNIKNKSYLSLVSDKLKVVNITYESLIMNPEEVLNQICSDMNIDRRKKFQNIEHGTKTDINTSFSAYQEKYLNPEWDKVFDSDSLDYVNQNINLEVLNQLGYTKYTKTANG